MTDGVVVIGGGGTDGSTQLWHFKMKAGHGSFTPYGTKRSDDIFFRTIGADSNDLGTGWLIGDNVWKFTE